MCICVCACHVVINGEKAAYSTPVFADKRERTLDLLLKNIEQNYSTKVREISQHGVQAMSHVYSCTKQRDILLSQSGNKKFTKEVEFRDYGQVQ